MVHAEERKMLRIIRKSSSNRPSSNQDISISKTAYANVFYPEGYKLLSHLHLLNYFFQLKLFFWIMLLYFLIVGRL